MSDTKTRDDRLFDAVRRRIERFEGGGDDAKKKKFKEKAKAFISAFKKTK